MEAALRSVSRGEDGPSSRCAPRTPPPVPAGSPRPRSPAAGFVVALLCWLALAASSATANSTLSDPVDLDLPEDAATRTLPELARQAGGLQIIFRPDVVAGVFTRAVRGRLAPREALDRMLEGTRLAAVPDSASGAVAVVPRPRKSPSPPTPSPAAESAATSRPPPSAMKDRSPFLRPVIHAIAAAALSFGPATQAQVGPTSPKPGDETVELSPFLVNTDRDTGYAATNSLGGTKMNTPVKDLPFTVDVITRDFLRDTGAFDIGSALGYTAGVDVIAGAGAGRTDTTISVRGLPSNFFLRDGVAFYRAPNWAMIERLEVIRGASAIVYGQTQPGGVVNMVTKKANTSRHSASIDQTVGQYDNFETRVDYNVVGKKDVLAFRIAGSYANQGSRRDDYDREAHTLSPSMVYQPNRGTTLTLQYAEDVADTQGLFFGLPPSNAESTNGFNYLNQNYQAYWNSKSADERARLKLPTPDSLKTASIGGPSAFFLKDPYKYNIAGSEGRWNSKRQDYVANLKQVVIENGSGLMESSHFMVNVAYIKDDVRSRIPLVAMGAPQGARGFNASWADLDLRNPANPIGSGNQWSIGGDYNDSVTNAMELINRNYYHLSNETVPGAGNLAGSAFFNPADATLPANRNIVPLAGPNTYFWYPMTYFLKNTNQINTVDWVNVLRFNDSTSLRLLTGVEHGRQKYYDPGRKGNLPASNFNANNDAWSSTAWGPAPSWIHFSTPMWGYGFAQDNNRTNTGQNPGTVWGAGADRKYRGWSVWNGDTGQRRGSHITGDQVDAIVDQYYYGLTQDISYTAFYTTGQLDLSDKKVQLLGALRYSDITKKDYRSQGVVPEFPLKFDPVVPQGGIVYNVTPQLNLYLSYAQNYWYEWTRNANEINEPPPTNEGESYEFGSKFSLADGRIAGSVSIFQSAYQNLSWKDYTFNLTSVRPDKFPKTTVDANGDGTPDLGSDGRPVLVDQFGLTRFDGEAETRGFELTLQARPIEHMDVVLSYSYLDTEITQGQEWAKGLSFSGVPENMASLWTKYGFWGADGPLKGLEVGWGLVYKSKAFVGSGFNQKELGAGDVFWETPNFIRFDAMVAYPFKWMDRSCRVQLNCRNVADRLNWTADANLVPDGQGREFYGSFNISF